MDKNKIIGLAVIGVGGYLLLKGVTAKPQEETGFIGGGGQTIESIESSGGTPSATGGSTGTPAPSYVSYNFPSGSESIKGITDSTANTQTSKKSTTPAKLTNARPMDKLTPTQKLVLTSAPRLFETQQDLTSWYNQVDRNGNFINRGTSASTTSTNTGTKTLSNTPTSKKVEKKTPLFSVNNIVPNLKKIGIIKSKKEAK